MATSTIRCSSCGAQSDASVRFCKNCGAQLIGQAISLATSTPGNTQMLRPKATSESNAQKASHHRAEEDLPIGEYVVRSAGQAYVITGPVTSRGRTNSFSRRAYFAVLSDGKTQVVLNESLMLESLRGAEALANIQLQAPLPHVNQLEAPFSVDWYGIKRYYVVEFQPQQQLSHEQVKEQPKKNWMTWTRQLALGLAALHDHKLALGISADQMLDHISIAQNGAVSWKLLGQIVLLQDNPEAQFEDLWALAGAMAQSKLVDVPAQIEQLLREAKQPSSRMTAEAFAMQMGSGAPDMAPPPLVQQVRPANTPLARAVELGDRAHKGMVREGNEDSAFRMEFSLTNENLTRKPVLLAVSDGMGGEDAGEVASRLAINTLMRATTDFVTADTHVDPMGWVQQTVEKINEVVIAEANKRGNQMGATLVFAFVYEGMAYLGNVGDSRIYRWNPKRDGGAMVRLVKDHSLVEQLVELGQIRDEERYSHPERNMILRSLGDPKTGRTDDNPPIPVQPGDWILLCSDGLWEMVRDEQIRQTLASASSPQAACDRLIDLANQNGGEDNIAVVIGKFL